MSAKPFPWKIGAWESGQAAIDAADGQQVTGFIDPDDARVILAAADLLAALQAVLADYDQARYWEDMQGEWISDARAAVARATGEQA